MSKKTKRIVMSLFMVAVLLVSSAFAFLTDRDAKTNTFTMGRVKIDLTEPHWDETNGEEMWAGKVMPKDPTIQNVGPNDAYVYAMVEVPKVHSIKVTDDNGTPTDETDYPLFSFTANEGWTLLKSEVGNGTEAYDYYLYAYDTRTVQDQSVTLFNDITFANVKDVPVNPYTDEPVHDIDVKVTAYAIQSDLGDGQIADAATAWELYATQRNWAWPSNPYEGSVEDLMNNHEFEYYSSFGLAATDVNNDTIGVNADVDFPDAVAGIYMIDGEAPTIVLFKDSTETTRTTLTTDVNVNMAGKELIYNNSTVGINISNINNNVPTVTIDGRIEGSELSTVGTDAYHARCLQIGNGCEAIANGVTFNAVSDNGLASTIYAEKPTDINVFTSLRLNNCTVLSDAKSNTTKSTSTQMGFNEGATCVYLGNTNAEILNCNITAKANACVADGVDIKNKTYAIINNCSIDTTSESWSYGVLLNDLDSASATANVGNCTIVSDSSYVSGGLSYGCSGILNRANANVVNCNVKGMHCAIANYGKLTVDGGTYEGYGHGGFYFSDYLDLSSATVKNATIRQCAHYGIYPTSDATAGTNRAGFYIGGDNNITVNMDNCDIYGQNCPFVIRSTANELNNTLIISNSRINKDYATGIRCNTTRHTLDIREGCNFTMDDVKAG